MSEEKIVWEGNPSQITNLLEFVALGVLSLALITIPVTGLRALWVYLVTKNRKYELTTQRLKTHEGVFSKKMEELELYRVTDTKFDQPFFLRIFGLANIILITSDKTSPTIKIEAIENAKELRETIRSIVEARKEKKMVREIEVN